MGSYTKRAGSLQRQILIPYGFTGQTDLHLGSRMQPVDVLWSCGHKETDKLFSLLLYHTEV